MGGGSNGDGIEWGISFTSSSFERGGATPDRMGKCMGLENWIQIVSKVAKEAEKIPFSQRFRDSWAESTAEHQVLFWLTLVGFFGLIGVLVVVHWFQQRKHRLKPIVDDPRRLFEDLLTQLELADEDKQVLRQMVSQARLRHPAVCLLSPNLLEWSRRVWQAEKGDSIEPETLRRIDMIAERLYDHNTPSRTVPMAK
jgi:hypothetical protein